eukprot:7059684-Pyramimonas_sp.AAC.5
MEDLQATEEVILSLLSCVEDTVFIIGKKLFHGFRLLSCPCDECVGKILVSISTKTNKELVGCLQAAFVAEDVNNIIKESIDSILLNATYTQQKVNASIPRVSD